MGLFKFKNFVTQKYEEYGDEEILIPFCIHASFGPIIILIYLFEFIFKSIKKKDDTKTLEFELERYNNLKIKIENAYRGFVELKEPTLEPQIITNAYFKNQKHEFEYNEYEKKIYRKIAGQILSNNVEDFYDDRKYKETDMIDPENYLRKVSF